MTAAEEGVLLLCCRLGDPDCKPLTTAQFRELGLRVRAAIPDSDPLSELSLRDLIRLGYTAEESTRILCLLERKRQLSDYLSEGERKGIVPLTRISSDYPQRISRARKFSAPPVLFASGDLSLLAQPSVAVVGSRQLHPENEAFAVQAGRTAAKEGLVLVSGNAHGADRTAQNACLEAGGSCIVFTADRLMDHRPQEHMLYLSEDGYDLSFSAYRALHRNSLIHIQGDKTIAAQCTYGKGGTWEGSLDNLKHSWSPLFVFDDSSSGAQALIERGATGVKTLSSVLELTPSQISFF